MSSQLQENLTVANHQFLIRTMLDQDRAQIVSDVIEKDRLLYQKTFPLTGDLILDDDLFWQEKASNAHQRMIEEVLSLFTIKERLSQVTQAQYHYRFGRVLLYYNFTDDAEEHFKKSIELKPQFIKAYRKWAVCAFKKRDFERALQILLKAQNSGQNYPDYLNDLAVAYTLTDDFASAKNSLERALEIKPNYPEANFNLGVLLFLSSLDESHEGQTAVPVRVIRALKDLKEVNHLFDPFWNERAEFVLEKIQNGSVNETISTLLDLQLKMVTRDDPLAVKIDYFFLKFMYGKKQLNDEELEYYENLISKNVNKVSYADHWNDLGVIHLIQCRNYFLTALEEIERAQKINPHFTEAKEILEKIIRVKNGFLILLRALLRQ